ASILQIILSNTGSPPCNPPNIQMARANPGQRRSSKNDFAGPVNPSTRKRNIKRVPTPREARHFVSQSKTWFFGHRRYSTLSTAGWPVPQGALPCGVLCYRIVCSGIKPEMLGHSTFYDSLCPCVWIPCLRRLFGKC